MQGVSKSFGKALVLKNVSITAKSGMVLGILGPSGCGKTTLLRIVAGLLQPDVGRIYFDDNDVTDTPPQKRNAGFVFQSLALFPNMTVWDNIAFGLEAQGWRPNEIEERVKEVVLLTKLEGLEKRYPRELSGGQQQRVALARALAPKTRLLLLDEPLASLDANLRSELLEEVHRIQRATQITTIYVTHDQSEAMAVSDEIALMFEGEIEVQGDVYDIYTRPKTKRAAYFLGVTNCLKGRVKEVTARACAINLGTFNVSIHSDLDLKVGDHVALLVRPEDVTVTSDPGLADTVAGVLRAVLFRGRTVHLRIETAFGTIEGVENRPESVHVFRDRLNSQVFLKVDFQRAVAVKET